MGSATPSETQTNQPPARPFRSLVLVKGESYRDAGPIDGQLPLRKPKPATPTTFSQPSLGQRRVVSGRWPDRWSKESRVGTLARSMGSATPSETQTNQPPPRPFHSLVLVKGESYRDAGPIEGQRYPFGNPNQSATPTPFHSLVLVKGESSWSRENRIGTLARSRGSATFSVTQTALCRWLPCWQTRVTDKGCQTPSKKHVGTLARSGQGYPYSNPNQSVRHMPDAFREGR